MEERRRRREGERRSEEEEEGELLEEGRKEPSRSKGKEKVGCCCYCCWLEVEFVELVAQLVWRSSGYEQDPSRKGGEGDGRERVGGRRRKEGGEVSFNFQILPLPSRS